MLKNWKLFCDRVFFFFLCVCFFVGGGGDGHGMESDIRRFGSKETLTQFFGGFTQFTHHSAQD